MTPTPLDDLAAVVVRGRAGEILPPAVALAADAALSRRRCASIGTTTRVEAALDAASARGLYVILRIQELRERRLVVVDGGVERQRTTRVAGVGVHALTPDGSIGFASVDDVTPEPCRTAVRQAGAMAEAARRPGCATGRWRRSAWRAPAACASRRRGRRARSRPSGRSDPAALIEAQEALAERRARAGSHRPDDAQRRGRGVADRSVGRDRRQLRDAARLAAPRPVRCGWTARWRGPARNVSGVDPAALLTDDAVATADAPGPASGGRCAAWRPSARRSDPAATGW